MQLSEQLARAFTSMGRLFSGRDGELPRADYLVLSRLDSKECDRSRELADAARLDPSTMSRRLASLEGRGLIARQPDPSDRRAQILTLTEAGRAAVKKERDRRVEMVTDALAGWDAADKAELARLLGRLTDTIESQLQDRQHERAPVA